MYWKYTATFLALIFGLTPLISAHPSYFLRGREVSPDNTCGTTGVGGSASAFTCPTDLPCCSVNGFCGSTPEYCCTDSGCQADFGTCKASAAPSDSPPEYGDGGSAPALGGGEDPERCGEAVGNCAADKCCSLAGFCGNTPDHCQAPNCQFAFGPACDANAVPAGTNTSVIPRPKLGNVLYGSNGVFDCENAGDMALTFDDGPFINTQRILDLMDQYGAKATFFMTGNNNGKGQIDDPSKPWPAVIQRMHESNHQLASHTWSHADLCNITSAQRKDEMYKLEMAMRNIVGVIPTYMRPPFSSCTAECGCEQDMEELGYHITFFDLDTSDYLNTTPETIINAQNIFSNRVNASNPAVDDFLVIAHDIHQTTAEVLVEHMLKEMQAKGYKGVTVGECLGDPKENWYRVDAEVVMGED